KTAANENARANMKTVFDAIAKTLMLSGPTSTTEIKIPLLVDAENSRFQGTTAGCDKIVYVSRTVSATGAPLNAVYKELFAKKEAWPYSDTAPGNFITSRTSLLFDKAEIVSAVAKVYLTGEVGPLSGVCD